MDCGTVEEGQRGWARESRVEVTEMVAYMYLNQFMFLKTS